MGFLLGPSRPGHAEIAGELVSRAWVVGLLFVLPTTLCAHQSEGRKAIDADVVVYEATPGSFCAAIAAAREGAAWLGWRGLPVMVCSSVRKARLMSSPHFHPSREAS